MILGRSIGRNAELHPDRPAVIAEHGVTLSHASFRDRVWRLADALSELGLGKSARVGILARNDADYLTLYFALGSLGICLVPLNYSLKAADINLRVTHAELDAFFLDEEFLPVVTELCDRMQRRLEGRVFVMGKDAGKVPGISSLVSSGRFKAPSADVSPEDILYIGYTSGTTGAPKGALVSHRAIVSGYLYKALDYELTDRDITINPGPYWHSAPRDFATLAIYLGGTAIIPRRFDPDSYLSLVERHRATNSFVVPTMLERLVSSAAIDKHDVSSMRCLMSGGAPLPSAVKDRVLSVFGPALHEFYGATETRIVAAIKAKDLQTHERSVGRPIADVEVRVLSDIGEDLPTDTVGEIYIRGPGLFSGYWRDPERTRAAHRGSWFSLGDMGRVDKEGFLYLVDRKQDMIISGGENIFPADIEECLQRHESVVEAAVIGAPDDRWGEIVVAYIVPAPGAQPTLKELADWCGKSLPEYMKPKRIETSEGLPRNPTGKLLRRELRRMDGERSKTDGLDERVPS